VTQAERIARRESLRAEIARRESDLASLREEEARLLQGCDHTYPDGRLAGTGGQVKICAVCGRVLPRRDDKLWG
jgi:hypothetical protein